jgi:hypothetical protein
MTAAEIKYDPNGGQTAVPPSNNVNIPRVDWTPLARPNPPLPPYELRPRFKEEGWQVWAEWQHELRRVTPVMVDWFWSNMEKCYFLWAPGDHKWFEWIDPPNKVGHVGSKHHISERIEPGGPIAIEGDIYREDMSEYPFTESLSHVIIESNPVGDRKMFNIHLWEERDYGSVHREIVVGIGDLPMPGLGETTHTDYEESRWCDFLPQLYDLWKDHPDPKQNVFYDLSVKKLPNGDWAYVADNKSPK